MNNHRIAMPGFSLLELVISMMISSFLMTAALTIYNQIGKSATIIQKITTTDTKIMILHDRLSKDLAGISPRWFSENMYEVFKQSKNKEPKNITPTAAEPKGSEPKNTESKKADAKIKQDHFFFAQNKENNLDFFSFITTNALQMYGNTNACFVRVVYKLIPDSNNNKVFRLMRKQDDKANADIDKEKIKEGSFYELANNISKLSIEYGFTIPSPQEQEKNPEKKISFKWIKQWNQDSDPAQQKEYKPLSPEAIKLTFSFLQGENKQEIPHEVICVVPPRDHDYPKSFAEKRHSAEQPKAAVPGPYSPPPIVATQPTLSGPGSITVGVHPNAGT